MRKVIVFLMVVSLLSPGLAQAAAKKRGASEESSPKIGYVDMGKVIEEYPRARELQEALQKEQEMKQKKIDEKREGIKKLEEELKAQESLLKEGEREKRTELIEKKKEELKQLFRDYDLEIRDKFYEEQRQVMGEISRAVESFGKENGYVLILDSRQVLYGEDDLTEEIIKLLNKPEKSAK